MSKTEYGHTLERDGKFLSLMFRIETRDVSEAVVYEERNLEHLKSFNLDVKANIVKVKREGGPFGGQDWQLVQEGR